MPRWKTLLFALLFAPLTHAATYYVSPSGKDNGRGSMEAPFATITRAAEAARPGDILQVRGGVYFGRVAIYARGTAARPIVIRAMPGEEVILDGSRIAPNQPVVELSRTRFVDFSGFEVRNSRYIGIVLWHARNTRIVDNHIHHTQRNGIYAGADAIGGSADITVSGNSVHDTVMENERHTMKSGGWAGAIVVSKTVRATIAKNRVWNNHGEGIISRLSTAALVRENEIFDNFSAYLYLDNAREVIAESNTLYSTGDRRFFRDGRPAAGIAIANETNADMHRSRDNVIRNNTVRATRWGFYYGAYEGGGGLRNTQIIGNTFSDTTEEVVRIEADTHVNALVADNTFCRPGAPPTAYRPGGAVTYRDNGACP
jgi:hypothetical protein